MAKKNLHVFDLFNVGRVDVGQFGQDGVRCFASIAESTSQGEVLNLNVTDSLEAPERDEEADDVQRYDHNDRQEEVVLQGGGI